MCFNIIILEGCRRFGYPNPLLSFTKLCDAKVAKLNFGALASTHLTDNDRQGCSNSLPDLFLSPTSSCNCTDGRRAADMVPLGQQFTELKLFLYHAKRGLLVQDGGLIPWPFQNAWSPEDTDFLGNNLLKFRMNCARDTVIAIEFSEDDPNQPPQEDQTAGHPSPAAQQEHAANHVSGGSPALAAEQALAANLLPGGIHPVINADPPQGEWSAQDDAELDDLAPEEEQSLDGDQPDAGNEAGPSNSRPNLKRKRSWSQEDTQLLLDLHAEKDANGKKVWTYPKMMREIPEFRDRTRNALESRVYWYTKNKTESAPPADQ